MPHVGPTSRPRIDPAVDWVAIDGEVVMIDGLDQLHLVGGTGAIVWAFLDGGTTVGELAEDVAAAFGVERDTALADLTSFVSQMVELGLVAGSDR